MIEYTTGGKVDVSILLLPYVVISRRPTYPGIQKLHNIAFELNWNSKKPNFVTVFKIKFINIGT